MRRRFMSAILSVLLLVALPLQVLAAKPTVKPPVAVEYVGLGDSIGEGWSASPGNEYFALYSTYLQEKAIAAGSPYLALNAAVAGLTTTQLRNEVTGVSTLTLSRAALPGATVVTISIGGNNLMKPLLDFVAGLYGVSPSDPNFMMVLSTAVNQDPDTLTNAMAWQILNPWSPLRNSLGQGVNTFKTDLPFILNGVKTLAPTSKVYLLTVYNPVYGNDTLRDFMGSYIDQINTYIKNSATSLGYTVVNVADAFNAYTGTEPLVGFNMAATPATYDPHPTDAGHRMIYDLLVAASTTVKKPRR
jgi:lysophospholipase L1-like esterase